MNPPLTPGSCPPESPDPTPEPARDWRGTYALVCALAVTVIVLLWLATSAFNIPRPA